MAVLMARNANLPPKMLMWAPAGSDTPTVYTYTCSVGPHLVLASVNLAATAKCPQHHKALTDEHALTVATS